MESKWFEIDEINKSFSSKAKPHNINQAWDKTLEKWGLVMSGYITTKDSPHHDESTCGLCNFAIDCDECPAFSENNRGVSCVGSNRTNEIQYMYLLFTREATK